MVLSRFGKKWIAIFIVFVAISTSISQKSFAQNNTLIKLEPASSLENSELPELSLSLDSGIKLVDYFLTHVTAAGNALFPDARSFSFLRIEEVEVDIPTLKRILLEKSSFLESMKKELRNLLPELKDMPENVLEAWFVRFFFMKILISKVIPTGTADERYKEFGNIYSEIWEHYENARKPKVSSEQERNERRASFLLDPTSMDRLPSLFMEAIRDGGNLLDVYCDYLIVKNWKAKIQNQTFVETVEEIVVKGFEGRSDLQEKLLLKFEATHAILTLEVYLKILHNPSHTLYKFVVDRILYRFSSMNLPGNLQGVFSRIIQDVSKVIDGVSIFEHAAARKVVIRKIEEVLARYEDVQEGLAREVMPEVVEAFEKHKFDESNEEDRYEHYERDAFETEVRETMRELIELSGGNVNAVLSNVLREADPSEREKIREILARVEFRIKAGLPVGSYFSFKKEGIKRCSKK